MDIQILVDNPDSWIVPHAHRLRDELTRRGHRAEVIHTHDAVRRGDVLFLLGCERILKAATRAMHEHNLVIHESDLPKGRGWSPTTWQVLEGKSVIPIALLEAADEVDAGDVYLRSTFEIGRGDLIDEIRAKQGAATIALALEFIDHSATLRPQKQIGDPSFYRRRTPKDSELDPQKTIAEQFDLLRVCDNERYPAFFELDGTRYTLRIDKEAKK